VIAPLGIEPVMVGSEMPHSCFPYWVQE
jgi:hypothetical protein